MGEAGLTMGVSLVYHLLMRVTVSDVSVYNLACRFRRLRYALK
jgi:hypothetical protein